MSMLKSLNPTCFILLAAVFVVILYYVSKFLKNKPQNFMLYLVLLALAAFTFYKRAEVKKFVRNYCFRSQNTQMDYFYDTDPNNNTFIKANLSPRQFFLLDRILMDEKASNGLKLSNLRIQELSRNDNDVIEAYERWRKCKNMNRSYHRVVYPDERIMLKSRRR
ncbi:MAG: hypothetical protein EHM72_00300 [Calditrichaeota bacterium]|nr:MAG: hypothetical protein EHM72_00300 [Calditrichota bacterium]